jgi:autotransporter passenger strand-loop-strand repeat protein
MMVPRMTPQSFRWLQGSDEEEALVEAPDPGQSANTAPTPWSAPLDFSAATNGLAVAKAAPAVENSVSPQPAGSGLVINLIADNSVASAPLGFVQAIQAAAAIYEQTFRGDNITINIGYGWGTFNNTVDPNLTGSTGAEGGPLNGDNISYSTLKSWLTANVNSVADATMVASLPNSISSNFFVASAEEKALGHFSGSSSAVDGAIGFGTASSPTFWLEAALHEIAHAIGRTTAFYEGGEPTVMDLLRYSSPGTFQWTGGQPAYLSIDGGNTKLANFSTISDYGDFAVDGLTPNDPFDYQGNGSVTTLTALDTELMNVLGFEVPLSSGQVLNISSGQGSTDVTVLSGGTLDVLSGGTASGTTDSGGIDAVLGTANGTTVDSDSVEVLVSGGTATGTTVNNGGIEVVASGATARGMILSSGGIDVVVSGGTASGTVNRGGLDIVDGGTEFVLSSSLASGTIVISGGLAVVESGGTGSGDIVNSGGTLEVLTGGAASGATVNSGGTEVAASGGAAFGTTVDSGGVEVLVSAGTASGTIVNNGGIDVVTSGGTARGMIVNSGGIDVVVSAGMASGTTVSNGGINIEVSGGTASGTTVSNGGIDIVVSGGTAIGASVDSGGLELVESGGIASATTISGGTFEVASGGSTGSGAVTFASGGGGTLQLDASVSFGGLVAGFGAPDHLDLRDIAFGSSTSVSFTEAAGGTSGTLTVTDGVHTANITLLGQYMAGQFTSTSDAHGGTLIGDPSVVAANDPNSIGLVAPHHA